jgi:hypothetical protein
VRRLLRLALLGAVGLWLWRLLLARHVPDERAGVSYADGSSFVLEPSSSGFDRLAVIARGALS